MLGERPTISRRGAGKKKILLKGLRRRGHDDTEAGKIVGSGKRRERVGKGKLWHPETRGKRGEGSLKNRTIFARKKAIESDAESQTKKKAKMRRSKRVKTLKRGPEVGTFLGGTGERREEKGTRYKVHVTRIGGGAGWTKGTGAPLPLREALLSAKKRWMQRSERLEKFTNEEKMRRREKN